MVKKENKIIKWLKQRRIWACVLSAIAAGAVSLGYPQIAQLCAVVAGGLGLASYVAPKK